MLSVRGPHLMTSVSCMTSPNDLSLMHDQKEPVVIYCAEIHNPDHAFAHTMSFQDDVRVLCHNALPATCQQEGQILLPLSSDQTPENIQLQNVIRVSGYATNIHKKVAITLSRKLLFAKTKAIHTTPLVIVIS